MLNISRLIYQHVEAVPKLPEQSPVAEKPKETPSPEQLASQAKQQGEKTVEAGKIQPEFMKVLPKEIADNLAEHFFDAANWLKNNAENLLYDLFASPLAENNLKNAADKNPLFAIEYAKYYANEPYAKEVMALVATWNPSVLMQGIEYFIDLNYAQDVVMIVAEKYPIIVLWEASEFKTAKYYKKVIKYIMETAQTAKPSIPLRFFRLYKNEKLYAGKVLKKAAQNAAEQNPQAFFKFARLFKNEPYAKGLMLTAVKKVPTAAMEYNYEYKDTDYHEEILKIGSTLSAANYQYDFFSYIAHIKNKPYTEQLALSAVENSPSAAITFLPQYQDSSYAKPVLLRAIQLDPFGFMEAYNHSYGVFEEVLGKEIADVVLRQAEDKIKIAEERPDFLESAIRPEELPLDQKKIKLYIVGVVHRIDTHDIFEMPRDDFYEIFFNPQFQKVLGYRAGELTYMNAISLGKAVYRRLEQKKEKATSKNIANAANEILKLWDNVSNRELFGQNTQLILFTHEEAHFNNGSIIKNLWERSGGRADQILYNGKGLEINGAGENLVKKRTLDAIRNAKGPTTILFSGHGSKENWAFAKNQSNNIVSSLQGIPNTINYKELGDALIESGNIKNFNVIGATCFAYDYIKNMFAYMESRGVKQKPYVSISEANKGQLGYSSEGKIPDALLNSLYISSEEGQPIKVGHFFQAEGRVWATEDPALFIGNPDDYSEALGIVDEPGTDEKMPEPKEFMELGALKNEQFTRLA